MRWVHGFILALVVLLAGCATRAEWLLGQMTNS